MDFSYNFRQAHQDRLEDAGIKRYGYQNTDGYSSEDGGERKRKGARQATQDEIANAQLLVK